MDIITARYQAFKAANKLYDIGYRAENKEELISVCGMTEEEAEMVCKELAEMEQRNGR